MGKKKKPNVVKKDLLNKKDTRELLGYLKRLQKCEESFQVSDMQINIDLTDDNTIYFKETVKWINAYLDVKDILSNRENFEKGKITSAK